MKTTRPAAHLTLAQIEALIWNCDKAGNNAIGLTVREAILLMTAVELRIFTEASLAKKAGTASGGVIAALSKGCKKIADTLGVAEEITTWVNARKRTEGGYYQNLLFVTARDFDGAEYSPDGGYDARIFTIHPDLAV